MLNILQRRLNYNLDLNQLWTYTDQSFTVRFKDLNEFRKVSLASRIKTCSPIKTVKNNPTITTAIIHEILEEINPIIFSEALPTNYHGNSQRIPHRSWARHATSQINGYYFKQLSRIIYKITFLKRNLTRNELNEIVTTTTGSRQISQNFINQQMATRISLEEPRIEIEEISMQDVTRAGQQAELRQFNYI